MPLSWRKLPAALAFCLAAAAPLTAAAEEAHRQVMRVLAAAVADLAVMPDTEPQRVLVALAEVNSGGWTDGRLQPVTYVTFPADGIQDVQAEGLPPEGMAAQMISKLALTLPIGAAPGELKGYRIHAAENCVVVLFDRKTELPDEKCVILGVEE